MKVYHASSVIVENPDTIHSMEYLDFGQGFYITTIREQAEKYAQRFLRRGKPAWLVSCVEVNLLGSIFMN